MPLLSQYRRALRQRQIRHVISQWIDQRQRCQGKPGRPLLFDAPGYQRRNIVEHTIRFAKQYLHWEAPRPRHPEQADRWTWLVVAAFTQLRLARGLVDDRRLPWERPLAATRLTPYRTLRAFPSILAALGTPAAPSKPCGRSPGRPPDRPIRAVTPDVSSLLPPRRA